MVGVNGQATCERKAVLRGAAKIFGKLYLETRSNFNAGHVQEGSVTTIGQQAQVSPGCIFDGRVTIGARNELYARSLFRGVTTGSDVVVDYDSTILGNLSDFVRIGEFAMVLNGAHAEKGSKIGDFSILGERSTLRENTKIGDNSCVGAGLVVTSNVGNSVFVNTWGKPQKVPPNQYVKYVNGQCVITGKQIELVVLNDLLCT